MCSVGSMYGDSVLGWFSVRLEGGIRVIKCGAGLCMANLCRLMSVWMVQCGSGSM